jgi:large subunit ribosomal protein L7/L12
MSVIDVVELIEAMEEKFGVSAAAPVAAAAAPADTGGDEAEEADDAPVDVHLAEVGDKKVDVIKAVRAITGLGLKDAKGLVDTAPSVIKEGVVKAEADEYAKQLEDAGAKVELK